jgi:putative tryptophan/tyrosine transport system substrate-binding protein
VVFAPVVNPVHEGIVESVTHSGGNVTGVRVLDGAPKAVEWLLKLVPSTKRVYVPYHPADRVSVTAIKPLPDAAARLGVELVLDEVYTPEEVMATVEALPHDTAILFIPTPSLVSHMSSVRKLAIARGIPAGLYSSIPMEDVLFAYGTNPVDQGRQAARLVDQILKGKKPAELLVETAKFFLMINLKTATATGLVIPDEILRQADMVIR